MFKAESGFADALFREAIVSSLLLSSERLQFIWSK
jgi:hypothetical protein